MKKYMKLLVILIVVLMIGLGLSSFANNRLEEAEHQVKLIGKIIQSDPDYDGPLKSYDDDSSGIKKVFIEGYQNLFPFIQMVHLICV